MERPHGDRCVIAVAGSSQLVQPRKAARRLYVAVGDTEDAQVQEIRPSRTVEDPSELSQVVSVKYGLDGYYDIGIREAV